MREVFKLDDELRRMILKGILDDLGEYRLTEKTAAEGGVILLRPQKPLQVSTGFCASAPLQSEVWFCASAKTSAE